MRERKRNHKKDHGTLLAFIVFVLITAGVVFLVASPSSPHTGVATQSEDAFYGRIENVPFQGQTTGTVKADTNCKTTETGLTNCIGVILAFDGTELHFNYTHDMSNQACLTAGDSVTIALLNSGTVKVVRG